MGNCVGESAYLKWLHRVWYINDIISDQIPSPSIRSTKRIIDWSRGVGNAQECKPYCDIPRSISSISLARFSFSGHTTFNFSECFLAL